MREKVLAANERLLPPDHPDLLAAKQNLAATRMQLGDLAGALALEEVVHAANERRLPPAYPDLLVAEQNLANTRYQSGPGRRQAAPVMSKNRAGTKDCRSPRLALLSETNLARSPRRAGPMRSESTSPPPARFAPLRRNRGSHRARPARCARSVW